MDSKTKVLKDIVEAWDEWLGTTVLMQRAFLNAERSFRVLSMAIHEARVELGEAPLTLGVEASDRLVVKDEVR